MNSGKNVLNSRLKVHYSDQEISSDWADYMNKGH